MNMQQHEGVFNMLYKENRDFHLGVMLTKNEELKLREFADEAGANLSQVARAAIEFGLPILKKEFKKSKELAKNKDD